MSEQPDSLRAADIDREFVAERLRNALNEGRLSLSEYDDRLRETYAARTYGELKGLLTDLPDVATAERSALATPAPTSSSTPVTLPSQDTSRPRSSTGKWIAGVWSGWLSTSLLVSAIWFASSIGSGHLTYFWPVWVIVPWGAVLLATTLGGFANGSAPRNIRDRRRAERHARHHDRHDHRGFHDRG